MESKGARITSLNLLASRTGRLTTFGILYVSQGIPLGFAAITMAAYMRREGLDVEQVGAFIGFLDFLIGMVVRFAPLGGLPFGFRFHRVGPAHQGLY